MATNTLFSVYKERWIYLSPHFDDAIISCGGLVWHQANQGNSVEIWTVCAGDPPTKNLSTYAKSLHNRWATRKNATGRRREEDINACQIVKATYRHLSVPDCIYRLSSDGNWLYTSEEAIFDRLHPSDCSNIAMLSDFLKANLMPSDKVVCPLTIGNHVDHQLTRTAAESLDCTLLYYADMPHFQKNPHIQESLIKNMQKEVYPIPKNCLKYWYSSISCYASQISTFWTSIKDMEIAIRDYWAKDSGIGLWKVS